jgi:hypothetical protein
MNIRLVDSLGRLSSVIQSRYGDYGRSPRSAILPDDILTVDQPFVYGTDSPLNDEVSLGAILVSLEIFVHGAYTC